MSDRATSTRPALVALLADAAARRSGWMMASAESCTGGLIAGACTDLAGSSDWFERGFVTYSNAAKTELLGVDAALIAAHGAVSEAVARAMAEGALARSQGAGRGRRHRRGRAQRRQRREAGGHRLVRLVGRTASCAPNGAASRATAPRCAPPPCTTRCRPCSCCCAERPTNPLPQDACPTTADHPTLLRRLRRLDADTMDVHATRPTRQFDDEAFSLRGRREIGGTGRCCARPRRPRAPMSGSWPSATCRPTAPAAAPTGMPSYRFSATGRIVDNAIDARMTLHARGPDRHPPRPLRLLALVAPGARARRACESRTTPAPGAPRSPRCPRPGSAKPRRWLLPGT